MVFHVEFSRHVFCAMVLIFIQIRKVYEFLNLHCKKIEWNHIIQSREQSSKTYIIVWNTLDGMKRFKISKIVISCQMPCVGKKECLAKNMYMYLECTRLFATF